MRAVGYFETTGAPVLITPLEKAKDWRGIDGDYADLIDNAPNETVFLFTAKSGGPFLFFNTETGNFTIFQEASAFAVIEIVYAPGLDVVVNQDIKFEQHIDGDSVLTLPDFGGLTALFDAGLNGSDLNLRSVGRAYSFPFSEDAVPDIAVIQVPKGTWEVSLVRSETPGVRWEGALFRLRQ